MLYSNRSCENTKEASDSVVTAAASHVAGARVVEAVQNQGGHMGA